MTEMLSGEERRVLDAVPETGWTAERPAAAASGVCLRKTKASLKGLALMGLLEHEFSKALGHRYRRVESLPR